MIFSYCACTYHFHHHLRLLIQIHNVCSFLKFPRNPNRLVRESVSSTAFKECLAIPHAISQYAINSFICVIHNDIPIPREKHHVNFVLMIGVAQSDMKYFKDAFDSIIDVYSSVDKTVKILETDTLIQF